MNDERQVNMNEEKDLALDDDLHFGQLELDEGRAEDEEGNEKQKNLQSHGSASGEEEFDFSAFTPFKTKPVTRTSEAGVLSIVYSKKNGKRVAISPDVIREIGNPKTVQIARSPKAIAISEHLGEWNANYELKTAAGKRIIYSSDLVRHLVDYYNLNFEDRTSITFSDVSYRTHNGKKVAIIPIK
ncbi:hypothetical protein GGR02_003510 [Anoxybacillus voinovskiensis]|uniref:Uncharacterized protein n=1 Tax=Anoxybacteroides voinovskiense TaxID=230470 RepID=A0A840E386_9BACL|nr:hypothetical protein [Anoxybacillus voinovskiensis]MBB4075656.1 hypothetical protein [Anoxybacillus voinovskiensis]GGJ80908.1 hypothetical protein GCM10008982_33060 [Anoxybacillus voinovskiensis]